MSRSWWTVEKYDLDSFSWVAENAIPTTSNQIDGIFVPTSNNVSLVIGGIKKSKAVNTYNYDSFPMLFHKKDVNVALISRFQSYLQDNTGIRFTTNAGNTFKGFITGLKKNMVITSGATQKYYLEVIFQQFSVDGSE